MSKYDGTRISQWGVTAPGEQTTFIESFDDSTIFDTLNCTAGDSTLPAWDGTSTSMVKGTASTNAYIEDLNRTPFAINNVIEDRARLQVFIPPEDYRKLVKSGRAISVYIGSSNTLASDYYRYDFQIGRLFEGWNTLIFDFSTFPSGDFGATFGIPDDDNLASIRFEVITTNASDVVTLYWDSLVSLDQGGAVPTFGTPGGSVFNQASDSEWDLRVTFVDEAGVESNAGPNSVTADNTTGTTNFGQITWDDIPISSNPAIVSRVLYRTVAGGSTFLFLATINDNVTTSYVDTIPDLSLGTSQPPIIGDAIFDNSPPPSAGICLIWKRTAFLGN
jgi:hypothetical protein